MKIIHCDLQGRPNAYVKAYIQENCTELEMIRWQTRPAVLVLPGGAYSFISDREGEPIALKFAAEGYQTFVLHYCHQGENREAPLLDAEAAMGMIRARAHGWQVRKEQIAVIGFSAGGNLALHLALQGKQDARPNALILGYPSINGEGCCSLAYPVLDENLPDECWKRVPPSFIWATQEDEAVNTAHSVWVWQRLNEVGGKAELHVFQKGGHGYATADKATGRINPHIAHWFALCREWLGETLAI